MTRPLQKRCPQCGFRQKDLAKHLPRCTAKAEQVRKSLELWRHPVNATGRNVVNQWTCACGWSLVAVDRHEGATPSMMLCEVCDGPAMSAFYACDQTLTPTYEWRCPTEAEYHAADQAVREYYDGGALGMFPITELRVVEPT